MDDLEVILNKINNLTEEERKVLIKELLKKNKSEEQRKEEYFKTKLDKLYAKDYVDKYKENIVKTEEEKNNLLSNTVFIEWLISYCKKYERLDPDFISYVKEVHKVDSKDYQKFDLFVDGISEYAFKNEIEHETVGYCPCYFVKYKEDILCVKLYPGASKSCRLENEYTGNIIDFNDVINYYQNKSKESIQRIRK